MESDTTVIALAFGWSPSEVKALTVVSRERYVQQALQIIKRRVQRGAL